MTTPANRAQAAPARAVTGFAALLAIMGWAAILTQMVLSVSKAAADGRGVASGLVNYFSYFTILTNLLVAVALTTRVVAPDSRGGRFFARPAVLTAIGAYIAVVGLAYHLLLSHLYNPTGLPWLTDLVFHYLMPALYLVYWWIAVPHGQVRWADLPAWTWYPLGYFAYMLARGAVTGVYPYPFVDPTALGYPRTVANGIGMLGGLFVIGAVLTGIKRVRGPA
jgi:hypothetical protein